MKGDRHVSRTGATQVNRKGDRHVSRTGATQVNRKGDRHVNRTGARPFRQGRHKIMSIWDSGK